MEGKARKARDNFTQSVLKNLSRRAGGKCCKCQCVTFGPVKNRPLESVNIGKGAHIAAAAKGGPRYDSKMTPEERASSSNGMWLCSNCHDTVDRDPATYPTRVLKEMKKRAEERVSLELGVAAVQTRSSSSAELVTSISAVAILEIRQAKTRFLESWSERRSESVADQALTELRFLDFEEDEYAMEVSEEVVLMLREVVAFCKVPVIIMEVIRRLKEIANSFNSSWDKEHVELVCDVIYQAIKDPSKKRSRSYQSGLALLKDLSSYKSLKENELAKVARGTIRKLYAMDETDAPPEMKRARLSEEDKDDEYHDLLVQLPDLTDTQDILDMENRIRELGYEPSVD